MIERGLHMKGDAPTNHRNIIIGSTIIVGALLGMASFIPVIGDHTTIPSHTTIAGVDVSGLTSHEATERIDAAYRRNHITIRDDTRNRDYTYQRLGAVFDTNDAVHEAMRPRSVLSSVVGRNIALPVSMDDITARTIINQDILGDTAVHDETLSYHDDGYTVGKGRSGKSMDMGPVNQSIIHRSCERFCTGVDHDITDTPMITAHIITAKPYTITDPNALTASANAFVQRAYTVDLDGTMVTIPKSTVSQWITTSSNNGATVIIPNRDAISSSMSAFLDTLGEPAKDETIITTPDGSKDIATTAYGYHGTKAVVENAADTITHAITSNQGASMKATMADVAFAQRRVKAPGDFTSPNGSPWVRIDLSAQTAQAYRGSTLVRTFPIATGTAGEDATDTGTYYVNVKYSMQTMRGPGYVSPDVKWVSYFNGGEGFHTALWNTYNITHGIPSSHGCANMFIDDAKWIYDFAPLGTKVEVVGQTPISSVR